MCRRTESAVNEKLIAIRKWAAEGGYIRQHRHENTKCELFTLRYRDDLLYQDFICIASLLQLLHFMASRDP